MRPTQEELKKKRWYRLLKVITIFLLIIIGVSSFIKILENCRWQGFEVITCPSGKQFKKPYIRDLHFLLSTPQFIESVCGKGVDYDYKIEFIHSEWGCFSRAIIWALITVGFAFLILLVIKKILLYILYGAK